MSSSDELRDQLVRIVEILSRAGVPHMLTGALVRNALAPARTSEDLDIVLDMTRRTPAEIRALFEAAGYRVEGPLKGNLGTRLVLDLPELEADLWLAPDTETHRREMSRAVTVEYLGRSLRMMDPEDYVLRKLVNTRVRRNPNDLDDAYQVLLHAWDRIDADRLIARASGHRVERIAQELVDLVREDSEKLERGEPLE